MNADMVMLYVQLSDFARPVQKLRRAFCPKRVPIR